MEGLRRSFKETKLVPQLIWESHIKSKAVMRAKKRAFFVPFILSEGNFFNFCVLLQCIVYWIHFQNIHTFTYQKTLLHTLFRLFLKSSKAVCVSLKQSKPQCLIDCYYFISWMTDSNFTSLLSCFLLVQSQQWKHQKNMWNLFIINNKDTTGAVFEIEMTDCVSEWLSLFHHHKKARKGFQHTTYTTYHHNILP